MGLIRKDSDDKKLPQLEFTKAADHTLSINTTNCLPQMPFVDPKAVDLPNRAYLRQRIILENMTRIIKKTQFPIMIVAIGVIIGVIALSILWSSVLKPYMESQQNFELKKLQGNLTSADKPPSLFDFKLPQLPMIGGGRPAG